MNECEIKMREIVKKCMVGVRGFDVNEIDTIDKDADLSKVGFDSIMYVKLTVDLETVFDIELPLEKLVMDYLVSIQSLCDLFASCS